MNSTKKLQIIGALQLIKNGGIRTLKNILTSKTYYRIKQELIQFSEKDNYLYSVFKRVKVDLQEMQSLKKESMTK